MSSGYIFFDIFGYGQVAYGQSCMVSGVQLVEGELPCIYNWDLSYAQAVSGETPFSGFTLGTVDNAFLFENNRNKIPFITACRRRACVRNKRSITWLYVFYRSKWSFRIHWSWFAE